MYCENCGAKIDEQAIFCPVCGEKVLHRQEMDSTNETMNQPNVFDGEIGWTQAQQPDPPIENEGFRIQDPVLVNPMPAQSEPQDYSQDTGQGENQGDAFVEPGNEEVGKTSRLDNGANTQRPARKNPINISSEMLDDPRKRAMLLRILSILGAVVVLALLAFGFKKLLGRQNDPKDSSASSISSVSSVSSVQQGSEQTPVSTQKPEKDNESTSFDGSASPVIDDFNWYGNADINGLEEIQELAAINGSWKAKLLYPGGEAYDLCNMLIYGYSPDSIYAVLHYDRYIYPLDGTEDDLGVMKYDEIREVQLRGNFANGQLSIANEEPMTALIEHFVTDGEHQYATGKISAPQYTDAEFILVRP